MIVARCKGRGIKLVYLGLEAFLRCFKIRIVKLHFIYYLMNKSIITEQEILWNSESAPVVLVNVDGTCSFIEFPNFIDGCLF